MEPEEKKETTKKEDTYELTFTNGALTNLKKLATSFDIPENDLRRVVNKAILLLTLVKNVDGKTLTIESKKGERYNLDVDKL